MLSVCVLFCLCAKVWSDGKMLFCRCFGTVAEPTSQQNGRSFLAVYLLRCHFSVNAGILLTRGMCFQRLHDVSHDRKQWKTTEVNFTEQFVSSVCAFDYLALRFQWQSFFFFFFLSLCGKLWNLTSKLIVSFCWNLTAKLIVYFVGIWHLSFNY